MGKWSNTPLTHVAPAGMATANTITANLVGNVTGNVTGNLAGSASLPDGSLSAPSASFSGDANTGMYRVGTDQMALVAGGYAGLEVRKSTGNFANIGLGGNASLSDQYMVLASRTNASSNTVFQVANPSTAANSAAKFEVAADAGNNVGSISAYPTSSTVHPYVGAVVVRPSGSNGQKLSLMGGSIANSYVTTYANGEFTSAGEVCRFNADKSIQLMQAIATPATPTSGVKIYLKADGSIYKLGVDGIEVKLDN